jgi:hypothetical protein
MSSVRILAGHRLSSLKSVLFSSEPLGKCRDRTSNVPVPLVSEPFTLHYPSNSLGVKHPSGAYDQIFIIVRQLRVCWCGALSLTRERVCRLRFLLVLASAVTLGPQSLGTRDHILQSQIRDFPFRRLVRLAGLRWRYSPPPPHGLTGSSQSQSYLATGGSPPISLSWHQAPWDSRLGICFPQLNPCGISPYVTSSLTGRCVCLLWMCLAFRQAYISHI